MAMKSGLMVIVRKLNKENKIISKSLLDMFGGRNVCSLLNIYKH